jgi:hypothetical protein
MGQAGQGGVRSGELLSNDGKLADNVNPADNSVNLTGARYRFQPSKNTTINIFAQSDGAFALGLTTPINPFFEGSADNSITHLGGGTKSMTTEIPEPESPCSTTLAISLNWG